MFLYYFRNEVTVIMARRYWHCQSIHVLFLLLKKIRRWTIIM